MDLGVECDLNENGSHGLINSNAWSPESRTVWEGLGGLVGMSLLEEVCH